MFFKLMSTCLTDTFGRCLSLFKVGLEKNGQTSISKISPMFPGGGGMAFSCLFTFLSPDLANMVRSQFPVLPVKLLVYALFKKKEKYVNDRKMLF